MTYPCLPCHSLSIIVVFDIITIRTTEHFCIILREGSETSITTGSRGVCDHKEVFLLIFDGISVTKVGSFELRQFRPTSPCRRPLSPHPGLHIPMTLYATPLGHATCEKPASIQQLGRQKEQLGILVSSRPSTPPTLRSPQCSQFHS